MLKKAVSHRFEFFQKSFQTFVNRNRMDLQITSLKNFYEPLLIKKCLVAVLCSSIKKFFHICPYKITVLSSKIISPNTNILDFFLYPARLLAF